MKSFVGIDLGTTFSVIAYINSQGQAEVIRNQEGNLITPSVIDLQNNPPLIGEPAKEKQALGEDGVYAFFKRDMGNSNAVYIENDQEYSPVDLSAMVLAYLKCCAEDYLEKSVTDAVITVPAYFNNMQRQATIEAGQKAGLNVLRIISEPTAAALAFGVRPKSQKGKLLIYDLGGGTFDVSLVEISADELRVIATAGDHLLGGKDWDDRILQYLASQFEQEFGVELIGENFNDLMILAEKTKISLSDKQSAKATVNASGKSHTYEITRLQFEELTQDLMERTQLVVNQVLFDAGENWADLEGAILVGGSTRMPMVREFVEKMTGKAPMTGVHPDQAVALGAAIQAAMDVEAQALSSEPMMFLSGRKKSTDVISNSLGLITLNDDNSQYKNSIIIEKNKPIPCQETRPYQLRIRRSGDNQLEVYMTQGETDLPLGCAYLGRYVFTNLPNLESKYAIIDLTYSYNINGVVEVTAVERSTQQLLTLTIEPLPYDVPDRFNLPPVIETIRAHLDLYMAFDLSGSMGGEPLEKAQQAAYKFLSECDLTNSSIGLIEFSDKTLTTVRLSQNAKEINKGIKNLKIGRTGYCNGTDPFNEIFTHLKKAKGLRYGLVLTDGAWSNQNLAIQSAKRCHEAGIEIIAIGFGGADKDFLRKISSREDLSFFTDLNRLTETFSTIAQELTEGGGQIDSESIQNKKKGLRLW